MTPRQLEALRKHLHFTAPDAARWIAADPVIRPGGVEERTWNRWEAGKIPVPDNIAKTVVGLVRWREAAAEALYDEHWRKSHDRLQSLVWYDRVADWPGDPVHWRPMQSAIADLLVFAALDGNPDALRLVPFDADAFSAWCGERQDTAAERTAWARRQPDPTPRVREMRKAPPTTV